MHLVKNARGTLDDIEVAQRDGVAGLGPSGVEVGGQSKFAKLIPAEDIEQAAAKVGMKPPPVSSSAEEILGAIPPSVLMAVVTPTAFATGFKSVAHEIVKYSDGKSVESNGRLAMLASETKTAPEGAVSAEAWQCLVELFFFGRAR